MAVIVRTAADILPQPVDSPGAEGVTIRWLIGSDDPGADHFLMRQFEVVPGGHTPRHRHRWEHEVYVLAGQGLVLAEDGQHRIRAGDAVLVPAGLEHQFLNDGSAPLRFLCLIPRPEGEDRK